MRALMRRVPDSFTRALSAAAPVEPIDVARAREQHAAYHDALVAMGARVTMLDPDEACPDCVFVEDTAVVAAGLVVITRPGAESRRAETPAVAAALAELDVVELAAPATLDGGDCMRLGNRIYVGRSARTNAAGITALAEAFAPRGVQVAPIGLPDGVLHLKCVCSPLADDRILLAEGSLAPALFAAFDPVMVPVAETDAANAVAIGTHVLVADGYPRTHERLVRAGFTLHPVPTSEVQKADGSLTCQSIVY